jgi:flagellar biosynthesis protein FlhB
MATMFGGLLAGAIQNRFQTASEALTPDWNRLNPVSGFQRVFSARMLVPTPSPSSSFYSSLR